MRNITGSTWIVGCVALLLACVSLPPVLAQEEPAEPPATPDEEQAVDTGSGDAPPEEKKKRHNGLFLSVAAGIGSIETLNTSIVTFESIYETPSTFDLEDQFYARAAIGWRLSEKRGGGDIRLIYKGYSEDTFDFQARGQSSRIVAPVNAQVTDGLADWWSLRAGDGLLATSRFVRWWTPEFDVPPPDPPVNYLPSPQLSEVQTADCTNLPSLPNDPTVLTELQGLCARRLDPESVGARFGIFPDSSIQDPAAQEAEYLERLGGFFGLSAAAADNLNVATVYPSSLNNRLQHFDLVYGQEFGRRRVSSHWWGGLRYFTYTGSIAGAAWLTSPNGQEGVGFTDGSFLQLLQIQQDSSGFGPTAAWEVDFNFFNRGLQLFLNFQAAFLFSTLKADSGPFISVVSDGGTPGEGGNAALVDTRISQEVSKSVWQNTFEIGARVNFKMGLQIEVGYSLTGYLDSILYPNRIFIPQDLAQRDQPITALFATQDYDVDVFYGGLAFQF